MAFRAPNRGLAAIGGDPLTVWLYNGTRWYPDGSYPGPSQCPGDTILWAGKLDYWLIGAHSGANAHWPDLCRFDGANLQWEPIAVPRSTTDRFTSSGFPAIRAGACFSWDNCWFFGDYGVALHWDGEALTDATLGLEQGPWLTGTINAAVARTDTAGNRVGLAVGATGGLLFSPLPPQPDGSPPPQLFGSSGGPFSPLAYTPPTIAEAGDPYRTDLVAADLDSDGSGWVAGAAPANIIGFPGRFSPSSQVAAAPLARLAVDGAPASCPGYDANTFTTTSAPALNVHGAYAWRALSIVPGTGSALAAGSYSPPGSAQPEPVIVSGRCGQSPALTRFVPVQRGQVASSIASTAVNDAWATTPGHLYHFTDGQAPLAPAGDDVELRQLPSQQDPTIFVLPPPVVQLPPAQVTTVTQPGKPSVKHVRVKPAIYQVRARLLHRYRRFTLYITFRVRRPVTIGAEGVLRGKVVASSGLKRFNGTRGQLVLVLDPHRWPKSIKWLLPRAGKATESVPAQIAWTGKSP
jgi:hypothetical protein